MRIVISQAAQRDLLAGFHFYEQQEPGVGNYFLDALFADIDSLVYTRESTFRFAVTIGCYPNAFRLPCTIVSNARPSASDAYLIVGSVQSLFQEC